MKIKILYKIFEHAKTYITCFSKQLLLKINHIVLSLTIYAITIKYFYTLFSVR